MLARKNKTGGMENLSPSLSLIKKKEPSFSFFSVSSKEGKQTWGWPKNKTHRLLSLSHSFLLKEPPSTTNERSLSDRVADKDQSASSSNASSPL